MVTRDLGGRPIGLRLFGDEVLAVCSNKPLLGLVACALGGFLIGVHLFGFECGPGAWSHPLWASVPVLWLAAWSPSAFFALSLVFGLGGIPSEFLLDFFAPALIELLLGCWLFGIRMSVVGLGNLPLDFSASALVGCPIVFLSAGFLLQIT